MTTTLSARRIRRGLLTIAAILTLVSLAARLLLPASGFGILMALVDVNNESSFPTWYASFSLAVSALLLGTTAWAKRRSGRREFLSHWTFLSATFALLSVEEIAGLHEKAGTILRRVGHFTGYLHYAWVIPAIAVLFILGLAYLRFLGALAPRRRNQFIAAGAVYILGAVGMEMIGGKITNLYTWDSTAYVLSCHLEEFLELCGVALFNAALIEHLAELLGPEGLRLRFSRD